VHSDTAYSLPSVTTVIVLHKIIVAQRNTYLCSYYC